MNEKKTYMRPCVKVFVPTESLMQTGIGVTSNPADPGKPVLSKPHSIWEDEDDVDDGNRYSVWE